MSERIILSTRIFPLTFCLLPRYERVCAIFNWTDGFSTYKIVHKLTRGQTRMCNFPSRLRLRECNAACNAVINSNIYHLLGWMFLLVWAEVSASLELRRYICSCM